MGFAAKAKKEKVDGLTSRRFKPQQFAQQQLESAEAARRARQEDLRRKRDQADESLKLQKMQLEMQQQQMHLNAENDRRRFENEAKLAEAQTRRDELMTSLIAEIMEKK